MAAWLTLACWTCAAQPQAPLADLPIRVDLHDVDAASAFTVLARGLGSPIVVGPTLDQRIDVSGAFPSGWNLLVHMARQVGAESVPRGPFLIIRTECLATHTPPSSAPTDSSPLSLYFQRVELNDLFRRLRVPNANEPAWAADLQRQAIAVYAKDLPRSEVMDAIAFASGLRVLPDRQGSGRLARGAIPADCQQAPAPRPPRAGQWPAPTVARSNHCPYRARNEADGDDPARVCHPLEFFPLHLLHPSGYVHVGDRYFALVESPDGVLSIVRTGDYLGQDFGKVGDISPEGIRLREIVPDADNTYHARTSLLPYGTRPPRTSDSTYDHVEPGSPQERYANAVGQLFATAHFAEDVARYCVRHLPADADSISTALSSWTGRNAKALDEIDRHFHAHVERKSQQVGEPAASIAAGYRREVTEPAEALVRPPDDATATPLRARCLHHSLRLLGNDQDVLQRHAAELQVIRSCVSEATCPTLR